MKRLRRRRARGCMSLQIDVPDTWSLTLVETGFLSQAKAEDRKALREATERFIASTQAALVFEKE